jgi:group I intron endonuclease
VPARSSDPYGIVYLVTNLVTNKRYVGQTTAANPAHRWRDHVKVALNCKTKKANHPLYRAIRKYGKEAFVFEILCSCRDRTSLDKAETEAIARLGTQRPRGYNLMSGGQSSGKHSSETRSKMRLAWSAPGARERRGAAVSAALRRPKSNKRLVLAITEAHAIPAVKERHVLGAARSGARPEVKRKKSVAMTLAHQNPETKIRHLTGILEALKRPEVKANRERSLNDPEIKARRVATLKKTLSTPEARLLKSIRAKEVCARRAEAKRKLTETA